MTSDFSELRKKAQGPGGRSAQIFDSEVELSDSSKMLKMEWKKLLVESHKGQEKKKEFLPKKLAKNTVIPERPAGTLKNASAEILETRQLREKEIFKQKTGASGRTEYDEE